MIENMAEYSFQKRQRSRSLYGFGRRSDIPSDISLEDAREIISGPDCNSRNRLDMALGIIDNITPDGSNRLRFLQEAWLASDDIYDLTTTFLFALGNELIYESFWSLLNADEEEWVNNLGAKFTIYRGCSEDRIDGISWTTDQSVAESFARGHRGMSVPNPVIASTEIAIEDVLLAVNDRQEFEIVIDPDILEEVWIKPFTDGQLLA